MDKGEKEKPKPFGIPPGRRWIWVMLALLLAINLIVSNVLLSPDPRIRISYTDFLTQLEVENIESVSSTGETINYALCNFTADSILQKLSRIVRVEGLNLQF